MKKAGTDLGDKRGPLQRISGSDVEIGRHLLSAAFFYGMPDGLTNRKTFSKWMPEIYCLRQSGVTFKAIAAFLTECGLKLESSTVRAYYSEMIVDQLDKCVIEMEEKKAALTDARSLALAARPASIIETLEAIRPSGGKPRSDE